MISYFIGITIFFCPDFEQKPECHKPFTLVRGVGCIYIHKEKDQNYEDGRLGCEKQGSVMFEFDNFAEQHKPLTKYLDSIQCKLMIKSKYILG